MRSALGFAQCLLPLCLQLPRHEGGEQPAGAVTTRLRSKLLHGSLEDLARTLGTDAQLGADFGKCHGSPHAVAAFRSACARAAGFFGGRAAAICASSSTPSCARAALRFDSAARQIPHVQGSGTRFFRR